MRMRKKKNLGERMARVSDWLVREPQGKRAEWLQPPYEMLMVELGCGQGGFSVELARRHPNALLVALERVPDMMVVGMERAAEREVHNVRFCVCDAAQINGFFAPGEIDALYINFCDPWPHRRHLPRRLVAANFLMLYAPLLGEQGVLRFKTDNAPLFSFGRKELAAQGWTITECSENLPRSEENIETDYERKFRAQGVPICFLEARPPRVEPAAT